MEIDSQAKVIRKALQFAEERHEGQVRKGSGSPYIHHPLMVSYFAGMFKKSKHNYKLIAAAILHDTIEDTETTPEELTKEFGPMIAGLVFELTDDKEEIGRVGKVKYQKTKLTGISNYGLYLKLCDRLANVSDQPKPAYVLATEEVLKYVIENRSLTKSHWRVIEEIRKVTLASQVPSSIGISQS